MTRNKGLSSRHSHSKLSSGETTTAFSVAHLISGMGYGGAEQVVVDLSCYLQDKDYSVCVISMLDALQRGNELIQHDIPFQSIGIESFWSVRSNWLAVLQLHHWLKEENCKLLHVHMMHSLLLALLLKCLAWNRRIVFTRHNQTSIFPVWQRLLFWSTQPLRAADIVFSEKETHSFDVKSGVVIPNGVSYNQEESQVPPSGRFVFLSVGMFRKQKNYAYLPEVALILKQCGYSDFVIRLCGDGETMEETKKKAGKLEVSDKFEFLGVQSDPSRFYAHSHAFILPSLWEGLPLSVLEAGLAGLPCIVTPVGALPDWFSDTELFFCEPEQFAATMIQVMEHYDEARQKGIKLKQKVESRFSRNVMGEEHVNLYKAVSRGR